MLDRLLSISHHWLMRSQYEQGNSLAWSRHCRAERIIARYKGRN